MYSRCVPCGHDHDIHVPKNVLYVLTFVRVFLSQDCVFTKVTPVPVIIHRPERVAVNVRRRNTRLLVSRPEPVPRV